MPSAGYDINQAAMQNCVCFVSQQKVITDLNSVLALQLLSDIESW